MVVERNNGNHLLVDRLLISFFRICLGLCHCSRRQQRKCKRGPKGLPYILQTTSHSISSFPPEPPPPISASSPSQPVPTVAKKSNYFETAPSTSPPCSCLRACLLVFFSPPPCLRFSLPPPCLLFSCPHFCNSLCRLLQPPSLRGWFVARVFFFVFCFPIFIASILSFNRCRPWLDLLGTHQNGLGFFWHAFCFLSNRCYLLAWAARPPVHLSH